MRTMEKEDLIVTAGSRKDNLLFGRWRQKGAAAVVWLLLLLFVFIFGNNEVRAEESVSDAVKPGTHAVTKGTNIQVRAGTPVTGKITATLNSGVAVIIESETDGKDGVLWYYITSKKPVVSGYVRSDLIDIGGTSAEDIKAGRTMTIAFNDVKVRHLPSLSGNILCKLSYGTSCVFNGAEYDAQGGYYWYHVTFSGVNGVTSGYVRQDYFNSDDYGEKLRDRGFPDSYISKLLILHDLYPGWDFEAYDPVSALDWEGAAKAQQGFSKVENISGTAESVSSDSVLAESTWIQSHLREASYDDLRSGFASGLGIGSLSELFSDEEGDSHIFWKEASLSQIKYYMDPRNFMVTDSGELNTSFFMFVDGKDSTGTSSKGVETILSTTSMKGNLPDESSVTYAGLVTELSSSSKVNPYLVAARLRQEHGKSTGDDLINGNYPGYEGYYNFFNIQANGSNPVVNGLKYAKSQGWNTRRKSISGGLSFLAQNYFYRAVPQDTLYKHRFNYSGKDISHQYMESLYAPHYEAKNVYKGYGTDINSASEYKFLIPVYKNMPSEPEGKP